MKRLELFEFEDFPWLPSVIRAGATKLLVVFHKMMGTADVISELILDIRKKQQFDQITDLGSGSGGAMIAVIKKLNDENNIDGKLNLILTDLHPNPADVERINSQNIPNLRYSSEPTDASDIGLTPKGLKTMIASFHHMSPATARKILKSAQDNKQPILIYEVAKNNVPFVLWLLFLPLSLAILIVMSMVMTLFVRPLTFTQLFFTYIIPLIPLVYAWDGQASLMRTYTFKDIESLLGNHRPEGYKWEIGEAKNKKGKKLGYYVMGWPGD